MKVYQTLKLRGKYRSRGFTKSVKKEFNLVSCKKREK